MFQDIFHSHSKDFVMTSRVGREPKVIVFAPEHAMPAKILAHESEKATLIRQGYAVVKVERSIENGQRVIIYYLDHELNPSEHSPKQNPGE